MKWIWRTVEMVLFRRSRMLFFCIGLAGLLMETSGAITTNCYLGSMYAKADYYANTVYPNTPPYDCLKLRPAGDNSLFWFPEDQDIDWRSTVSSGVPLYLMWRTTIWAGTDPQRDSARLVTYDDLLEPSKRALDLTVENLVLENVELDTDSVTIRLQGDDLTWTLRNALFEGLISFYGPAPLAINVVETNSTIKAVTRKVASVTSLNIEPGAGLEFFGCGALNTTDPNRRLNFYREGSGADINGGLLQLNQSSIIFETGTNLFQLRNGARLELDVSGSRLDATSMRIDDSIVEMNNNTTLNGDELFLNNAQIDLSPGAELSGFVCRPESGTNVITIKSFLGGVSGSSLQMSGSDTVLRVDGLPSAPEDGNFNNDGAFELGQGTLIIGNSAFYIIRPSGVFLSRPEGRVVIEPGGTLTIAPSYILDMSAGLDLEINGKMTVDGTLVAYGDINGTGSSYALEFDGGTLQLATNASVVTVDVDKVYFDPGSKFRMKLDPSGAETQRLDINQTLDLSGIPELQLDLVNDTALPPGTKVVLCDYDDLESGHFQGLSEGHVFTLGANTWRIRYADPYYSDTNSSVITLTAGANDPPDPGTLPVFSLFVNSTNHLPVLADASDPDDDPLSIVSVNTSNGVAWIDGDDVVYAPAPGFTGTNVMDYCITDGTFTNCPTITVTVSAYPSSTPTRCYPAKMGAVASYLNNRYHSSDPPYNCVELTPGGSNELIWFEEHEDIDWRDIYATYRMWQTAKWIAPPGPRVDASLLTYDANLGESVFGKDLTVENLILENVYLDAGFNRLHFRGGDLSWSLVNSKFDSDITLDPTAPFSIDVSGGTSDLVGVDGRMDSVTTLTVAPDGELILLGCGSPNSIDPDNSMYFYREGSAAEIDGGKLTLDQSWVVFETGANQFHLRNGARLQMEGQSRLDASSVRIDDSMLAMNNNTILHGDELILNNAQIDLSPGAELSGFVCRPESGTNVITIKSFLGGVSGSSLQMSGSDTVLRVDGLPSAPEDGNYNNVGAFELGQGTLIIGSRAFYVIRPSGVFLSRPEGRVVIEPRGTLTIAPSYILDMSAGLDLEVDGNMTVNGTLTAFGDINGTGSLSKLEFDGGTLQLATNASVVAVNVDEVYFDPDSKLRMKLDPSGAETQRLDINQTLDLSGIPELQLDLVNDTLLPPGTKIVLCDYNRFGSGTFDGMPDEHIFQLGLNTWRIRYGDPYVGDANTSVITLTAGANDPPIVEGQPVYHVFTDSTNSLPTLDGATDPDGDTLSIASASTANGTVTIAGSNVVYIAPPAYTGTNIIDYCVTDGTFTNCSTLRVVVSSYDPQATRSCFVHPMSSYVPYLNGKNHPNTPPFNCLDLYPSGNNTAFWFDSDEDIDWRDIYGDYRMWESVTWDAPDGPRIPAYLLAYDGDLNPNVTFKLRMQELILENVDLNTAAIDVGLRGYTLFWGLRNARYAVQTYPMSFDSSAPLSIGVDGGESEIVGLNVPVDSTTAINIAPGATLLLTDCGTPGSTNTGERLDFHRFGSTLDVDGGALRLNNSQVAFNTLGGAFTVANGGALELSGTATLLETSQLEIDGSVVSIEENASARISDALSLINGTTLQLPVPAVDPVLPYGSKLLLFDYGSLTGTFTNLPDGTIFTRGVNTFEIRYSDPDYDAGNPSVITLTAIEQVPIAPTALSAINITDSEFVARWTDEPHASAYYLDVSESTNFTDYVGAYSNWNAGNATAGLVTGLVDQTTYYYRVRAGNPYGTSPDSNIIAVPVSTNTPYVQYELTNGVVSAGSSSGVDLSQLFHGSGLTYSVVSNSNPALVSASITGGRLLLSFTPGLTGQAQLTVRATASSGYFVDTVIMLEVVPEPGLALGAIVLDPQDGLFEQVVTVTNRSTVFSANSVTLTITNLSAGASVYNATGQDDSGNPVIVWNGTLAPQAALDFTVRYYTADRGTVPSAQVVASLSLLDIREAISGRTFAINGMPTPIPGTQSLLIEFSAIPGTTYYVQYANTLSGEWKTVYPAIVAPVNQVQWIDAGPPGTESPPLSVGSRFYRVIEITE